MLVWSLKMLKVSLNPLLSASPLLFFYYSPLSMVYFLLIREDITIFDCEFSHMGEQAIAVLDNSAFITYLSSLLISSLPLPFPPSPSLTSYSQNQQKSHLGLRRRGHPSRNLFSHRLQSSFLRRDHQQLYPFVVPPSSSFPSFSFFSSLLTSSLFTSSLFTSPLKQRRYSWMREGVPGRHRGVCKAGQPRSH